MARQAPQWLYVASTSAAVITSLAAKLPFTLSITGVCIIIERSDAKADIPDRVPRIIRGRWRSEAFRAYRAWPAAAVPPTSRWRRKC
jgi:hypothetical protein